MNEILYTILALIAGLALGTLFFGGLWFTVKKAVGSKAPALWILGSFIFRVSITLVGFYCIASGSPQRLIISLAGFIIARIAVLRVTKSIDKKETLLKERSTHEAQS